MADQETPTPAQSKKGQNPVDAAMAKALAHYETTAGIQPDQVANAEKGWRYYWLDSAQPEMKIRASRIRLESLGYTKATGNEYVTGCSTAEIWRIPQAVYDLHFRKRVERDNERKARFKADNDARNRQTQARLAAIR